MRFQLIDVLLRKLQRQQIGIGEIAVIVRFFLAAHGPRLALGRIEKPRFLVDRAAVLDDADLALGFRLDRLPDEADRVDVLDLAARAQVRADLAHRHIHVGAQVALFHVAVAGFQVPQDGAQLGDIGLRLLGRAHVRLGDDLHQCDTRAVQIHIAIIWVLVVDRLAGVLLQMQPLDANLHRLAVGLDFDHAFADNGVLVLADLVALRQIGIKVVLAVENRAIVDFGLQTEPSANGLRHAFLIDHGQHARHRRIHQRHMRIGFGPERGGRPRKQFRLRVDLGVDFKPDHDLPRTRCALHQVLGGDSILHRHVSSSSGRRSAQGTALQRRQAGNDDIDGVRNDGHRRFPCSNVTAERGGRQIGSAGDAIAGVPSQIRRIEGARLQRHLLEPPHAVSNAACALSANGRPRT